MRAVELTDRWISRIEKYLDNTEYTKLMEGLAERAVRIVNGGVKTGHGAEQKSATAAPA